MEPGVTVGEVTDFLLSQRPKPLMLECCLEMEDATLGGLAMAQGMTTVSLGVGVGGRSKVGRVGGTVMQFRYRETVGAR